MPPATATADPVTKPNPVTLCGAKNRAGKPCRLQAGHGTKHPGVGRCRRHGGSSPQAELGGQVILARREAAVMGTPLPVEPHEAILECIRIAAGEVAYASERISELAPDEAVGPVTITNTRPRKGEYGMEEHGDEVTEVKLEAPALHVWITVRHHAMDRLVTYSKVAIAAGIEERRVKLAESQGALIATAVRNILAALGVADDPRAPEVVRRELTVIAGGQAI